MSSVWTAQEIAEATGGTVHGAFEAKGVAFDSREIQPGDLFIAMKGEATDGHRFLDKAFAAGAAGALVRHGGVHRAPDGRPALTRALATGRGATAGR